MLLCFSVFKLLILLVFKNNAKKNMMTKTDSKSVVYRQVLRREANIRKVTGLDKVMEKRTFIGMIEAGEPLLKEALDAMRAYHQAQDEGKPAEEIERLHLLAESLFQVVCDYQLRVVAKARGKELPPLH